MQAERAGSLVLIPGRGRDFFLLGVQKISYVHQHINQWVLDICRRLEQPGRGAGHHLHPLLRLRMGTTLSSLPSASSCHGVQAEDRLIFTLSRRFVFFENKKGRKLYNLGTYRPIIREAWAPRSV